MKILKLLLGILILAFGFLFAYAAMVDVPVPRKEVIKTIPNERFFNEK